MAIISIAQQASPNVSGQIDLLWAQVTAFSTVVSMSSRSRSAELALELALVRARPGRRIKSRSELSP